jgi:hypothetical protein
MVLTLSIENSIGEKLAKESKIKGITIQAHIRNILGQYNETKEKNQTESKA